MDGIFQRNLKRKLLSMKPEEIKQLAIDLNLAGEMAKYDTQAFLRKVDVISIVLAQ